MKLYLIRHGQTDWNEQGRIQGSIDTELNETGILQAKELGNKILGSDYNFTRIYSSRQKRALKTAKVLSDLTKAEVIPIDGVEEINLGVWEGLTWPEVRDKYPKEYEEWYNNRRFAKPPRGESYQEMVDRVIKAIHNIMDENSEDVAIVTHGAVIMCLQCYLTDTPFNEMKKFKAENSSIIELDSELFKVL